jgi:hypothetical protein
VNPGCTPSYDLPSGDDERSLEEESRMASRWARYALLLPALLLVLLALPGAVAADTCACDPIQPFLVVDRFDETHVTYRHSDNPGIIYASNKTGSWVRTRLTSRLDEPYAIAVDAAQKVYIIFRRLTTSDNLGFFMVSNRTGTWVTQHLATIHEDAYRVRIAVDPDRKIHLASTTDLHAWYSTNETGTWTRQQLDQYQGQNGLVAVDAQGHLHLLFNQCLNAEGSGTCEGSGIYYRTNRTGSWVTVRIAPQQQDTPEDLTTDGAGNVHVVFSREYWDQGKENTLPLGVFYVTNAGGTWRTLKAAGPGRMAQIERTPGGQIHIVYAHVDGNLGIFLATLRNGVWYRSEVIPEYAFYPSTGIESDGRLHIAFMRMAIDPGIYHAVWQNGAWSRRELMD